MDEKRATPEAAQESDRGGGATDTRASDKLSPCSAVRPN